MSINEAVSVYLAAKAEEKDANRRARLAKARAEEAAAAVLAYAAGRTAFETDAYAVALSESVRIILDQKKLFADFPGIKNLDQYGTESKSLVITALVRAQAEAASA